MQLSHPGRQTPRYVSRQPVAPSAVACKLANGLFATPRALVPAEIEDLIRRFARTAAIARSAGFDGVEVHAAHGYLVSQFLSPLTNLRDDDWGGSPDRRMRFLLEVVRAIRAAVGPGFPVGVKLNSADFQRGGFAPDESMAVVDALAAEGIDLIEISGGTFESAAMLGVGAEVRESTRLREAYFLEYAAAVRQRVKTPLMLTGGFRTLGAMEAAVASGAVDLVGLARPMCLDPDLPGRLLGGTVERAPSVPIKLGLGELDGLVEQAWYTQQMHRMARGLEPDLRRGAWQALATMLLEVGTHALQRKRF